jgi:protein kinase X
LGILIFEMLAGWVIENSGSLLNPFFYTYTNSNLLLYRYPPFFDDNPFGIYEKILAGKLRFPSHFDPTAKDLVKKLLTSDRSKRLGNLKGGPDDIKKHKWFRGVDWQGLLNKTVQVKESRDLCANFFWWYTEPFFLLLVSQAPIVPPHQHSGDTSNFEKYADPEPDQSQNGDLDPFRHLFPSFWITCFYIYCSC